MNSLDNRLKHVLVYAFGSDTVEYQGITLPAKALRSFGQEYHDDEYFLLSAQKEANRLIQSLGMTTISRVLDVGCGVGRLPIGILSIIGEIRCYRGVDVNKSFIQWYQRHVTKKHRRTFQFVHINAKNLRYNPDGNQINTDFRFPFDDQDFDIIYLYGVFPHMTIEDINVYLSEFQRLLIPSGKLFLTAYIEEGVPDVTVNPQ